MDRRKFSRIGIWCILFIALAVILFWISGRNKSQGVSRYTWIYNLTDNFQIENYENTKPYFRDVGNDNPYFDKIQSAYEFGILENKRRFNGDDVATGEFVALTAMKAIGCYKVQIYMGLSDSPSDKEYIELAIEKGIITDKLLKKGLSKEQALNALSRAKDLYYSELWVDDFVNIEYQEGVIQLMQSEVLEVSGSASEIAVSDSARKRLSVGSNIVFTDESSQNCIARKVVEIRKDGIVKLEDAVLQDVLTSYVVSDMEKVSVDDILEQMNNMKVGDFVQSRHTNVDTNKLYPVVHSNVWDWKESSGNLSVFLSNTNDGIRVELSGGSSIDGISFPVPIKGKKDVKINASINISNIGVGVQMIHNGIDIQYVNIQTESNISVEGDSIIETDDPIRIPLFCTPIYLGNGTVGVSIPFYLIISAEGSFSLQAEIPISLICEYSKDVGLRSNANVECNASVAADCKAECVLEIEPILKLSLLGVVSQNIFDVETDIGIEVKADEIIRGDSNILSCMDLDVSAPILSVTFLGDQNTKSLLANIIHGEVTFNIISADSASCKATWHYEIYRDGTSAQVPQCTYGKEQELELSADFPHSYVVQFTSDFEERDEYYEVHGRIWDCLYIPVATVEKMQPGDTYYYDNIRFTFVKSGEYEETSMHAGTKWFVLKDDGNNFYLVMGLCTLGDSKNDGPMTYVYPLDFVTEEDRYGTRYLHECGYYIATTGNTFVEVKNDYLFVIEKKHMISIKTSESERSSYSVEEIVTKEIKNYDDKLFSKKDCWLHYIPMRKYRDEIFSQEFTMVNQPTGVYRESNGVMHQIQ